MDRSGKLFLLLLLLVAVAIGGWLAFASGANETSAGELAPAPVAEAAPAGITATRESDLSVRPAAPARTTVPAAAVRAEHDPEIAATLARFQGRVVHHDGQPAAERRVRFYRIDAQVAFLAETTLFAEPIADFPDALAGDATTGTDGRFELAGVWPRSIYLIRADAGGPNPTLRIADRTPGPGETVDLGDFVLKNAAVATGIVVDESGDPIAGAMVRAADVPPMVTQIVPVEQFDPEGWLIFVQQGQQMVIEMPAWVKKLWLELPVPTTTSGADGTFRLEGIEPGVNLVAATKSGFLSATQKNTRFDAGKTRDVGKLVLREGEVASGRVVDRQGKPVEGVQVVVGNRLSMPPMAFGRAAGATDARGRFECTGLGSGDVVAAARRALDEPWVITQPQSIQKELVITLPSRHALTVRFSSEAALDITTPRVRLLSFGSATGESELPVFATLSFARPLPLAGRESRLEDGRIRIADLDAGKYSLIAGAAGHAPAFQTVTLESDLEVDVRLAPEQTVDVVVLDQQDAPIRNAAVYVGVEGKGPETMPVRAGVSDASGKVRVREANGTSATIEATHPRYGVVSSRVQLPAAAPVILRLLEPGAITGVVSEGPKPPPLAKYMVVANRAWDVARGPISGMPAISTLDAEGNFALRGLQPGKWNVVAVKSFQAITSMTSFMQLTMMRTAQDLPEETVELTAGHTVQVRLDTNAERVVEGPSARISGTVFVDGKPGEGMVVFGWGEQQVSATVDAGGQFDLGQVKVGSVSLRVAEGTRTAFSGYSDAIWAQQVEVKEGKDVTLRIDVVTGVLAGVVLDRQGAPASGARVRVRAIADEPGKPSSGGGGTAIADAEGLFEIKSLPAGRYQVAGDADERGRGGASVTVPTGGRAEIRLQLERTYMVKGTLDRKLLPLAGEERWVWLSFEWQGTDKEGAGSMARSNGASVNESDNTFTTTGLLPGRYRIRIHADVRGEWTHDGLVEIVDRDLEDFVIQPVEKKPVPPPASGGEKKANR